MAPTTITERQLKALVGAFYAKARADAELGPVFARGVSDWPEHLETLTRFWSAVMLTNGRYKGNPLAAHQRHLARLTPAMFGRWLAVWRETTSALVAPPVAEELQAKAERIARKLQFALFCNEPTKSAADGAVTT